MPPTDQPAHADALAVARQHAEAGRFADFLDLCQQVTESHPDDLIAQLDIGALLSSYGFLTFGSSKYHPHLGQATGAVRSGNS